MLSVKNVECTTAEDFLLSIRRSNDQWWKESKSNCNWVFRGVGDAEKWKLLPSAWRPMSNNKLRHLFQKIQEKNLT